MWQTWATMVAWAMCLSLLAASVHAAATGTTTQVAASASMCNSPSSCYLQSLEIAIPDFCTTVEGAAFCLTDGLMHDFNLMGFPSSYEYPTTISGEMDDFSTIFTANYQYGYLKGVLTATAANANINMDTDIVKDTNSIYPISTNVTACHVTSITITVDVTSWIIPPVVERAVASFITGVIEDFFCETLASVIDVNVTSLIVTTITPKLIQIVELANETTSVPSQFVSPGEYVNWKESPLEAISMFKSNEFIRHVIGCMINSTGIYSKLAGPMINYAVDYATHGTGVFTLSLPAQPTVDLGLVNMSINSLSIAGLDTFTSFNLVEPQSGGGNNITLSTEIRLDRLALVVNTSVTSYLDPSYSEVYLLTVHVYDVMITVDVAVAMDAVRLNALYVDQLVDVSCILSTIDYLNVTSLGVHLNITSIGVVGASGSADRQSGDVAMLLDSIFALGDVGYNELLTALIAGVAQGPVRAAINGALSSVMTASVGNCSSHVDHDESSDDAILTWADSHLMMAASTIIDSVLGTDGVNKLMMCATSGTGVASFAVNEYWQVDIGGLNSMFNLSLLTLFDPTSSERYDIGSAVGLGSCGAASCEDFYLKAEKGAAHESTAVFSFPAATTVIMSFESLFIDALTLLKFNVNRFKNLKVQQLATNGCIASSIDTASLQRLSMSLSSATLSFDGIGTAITSILQKALYQISIHLDSLNARLGAKLADMDAICANGGVVPNSGGSTATTTTFLTSKWGYALITLSVIFVVAVLAQARRMQYLKDGLRVLPRSAYECGVSPAKPSLVPRLWSWAFWKENVVDKYRWRDCLICDASIALPLRITLMAVAVGDLALFLVSNLAPDAVAVMVYINRGTPAEISASVFTFGLSQTVSDMWQAKSYFLAFLIAFLSGFWPYAKLVMMVACLLLPKDLLHVQTREGVLRFLDFYGKWSLLDVFVMVMMMCAFHLELPISVEPYLMISVLVTPHYAFFAFLYATMLSLSLGHIVLSMHRFVEEGVSGAPALASIISTTNSPFGSSSLDSINNSGVCDTDANATVTSLSQHCFTFSPKHLPASSSSSAQAVVSVTPRGRVAILLLLLITTVLLAPALLVDTFEFEIKGLAALLIEGSATTPYNFYSVGMLVPEASGETGFNIRFVQFSYFIFGFVFPFVLVAVIFAAFFVPLSLAGHKRLLVFLEVALAWSALDCFLLSIAASIMQIQQFAAFIVGDSCDGIDVIVSTYLDTAVDGDDKCFDVVARLLPASAYLFVAILLLTFIAVLTLRALDSYIEDKAAVDALRTPLLGRSKWRDSSSNANSSSSRCGGCWGYVCRALSILHAAPAFLVLRIGLAAGMLRLHLREEEAAADSSGDVIYGEKSIG